MQAQRQASWLRWLVPVAILCVLGAIGWAVVSRDSYTVHVEFANAGRLVKGGQVQIAGRTVGKVSEVELTDDARARVTLDLDSEATPLRVGARAQIRAIGAGTLNNNFVDLHPGPRTAPNLPDGATLSADNAMGIVDLDAVLSSLDAPTRRSIQDLVGHSADVFAGSGARHFNQMLGKLDPALAALGGLGEEIDADSARVERLITTANVAAGEIRSRRGDLRSAVGHTARGLTAIARERDQLASLLRNAPPSLRQGRTTLVHLSEAVTALRPALRDVPAAAPPLDEFLGRATLAANDAGPAAGQLREQLPDLRQSFLTLAQLEKPARQALPSTRAAMKAVHPIVEGIRYYGSDLVLGVFDGLFGIISGNYNKAGHYAHVTFAQPYETIIGGAGNGVFTKLADGLNTGLFDLKTKIRARCPGGGNPTTPDGSSPWNIGPPLCNPADNTPDDVNRP